jgi:hypothetical protein
MRSVCSTAMLKPVLNLNPPDRAVILAMREVADDIGL